MSRTGERGRSQEHSVSYNSPGTQKRQAAGDLSAHLNACSVCPASSVAMAINVLFKIQIATGKKIQKLSLREGTFQKKDGKLTLKSPPSLLAVHLFAL